MSYLAENLPNGAVWGVTELVLRIRGNLERAFPFVWVKGEITDYSKSGSGHIYFSLKDEQSLLPCVWFAGSQKGGGQKFNQLTGEVYEVPRPNPANLIANGMEVICAGKVSFFGKGGKCQLLVEFVELAGEGLLAQAFEILRKKLAEKGLFAAGHKKKLPLQPASVALVTSLQGAALHDFLKIASQRGISSVIRIYPVPVQGEGAESRIAEALTIINSQKWADVIVLIRGGGSKEDLWSFNEEILVKAIYDSEIPLLTGIGHEIDLSLSDLAADVHAATPSHAAQMLWPLRREMAQSLDMTTASLDIAFQRHLEKHESKLDKKIALLRAFSPLSRLNAIEGQLANLIIALNKAQERYLAAIDVRFMTFCSRLGAATPALKLVSLEDKIAHLDTLLRFRALAIIEKLTAKEQIAKQGLYRAIRFRLGELEANLQRLSGIFEALNPENPLLRGYALVFSEQRLIRSVQALSSGEKISIRMADGIVEANVISVRTDPGKTTH